MSQQPPNGSTAAQPLRARLVIGWALLFAFVLIGVAAAVARGRAIPGLLDVMVP